MKIITNGIIREMTEDEIADYNARNAQTDAEKIWDLKQQLAQTDYKAIKYAEGWISEADYAPIKAERQKIRDEINRFERVAEDEYTEETDTV